MSLIPSGELKAEYTDMLQEAVLAEGINESNSLRGVERFIGQPIERGRFPLYQ